MGFLNLIEIRRIVCHRDLVFFWPDAFHANTRTLQNPRRIFHKLDFFNSAFMAVPAFHFYKAIPLKQMD